MQTFKVKIREVYEQEIEIEAENEDDAIYEADKLYYDHDIIFDRTDFANVEITIIS